MPHFLRGAAPIGAIWAALALALGGLWLGLAPVRVGEASYLPPIVADESAFTQGSSPTLMPQGCLYATSITNLSAGQSGAVRCTLDRKAIVQPYETRPNLVNGSASATATTSTQVIAAAGAGLYNCIGGGLVANTGANDSLITIQDGSGGAALAYTVAPAKNGFGGSNFTLSPPICGSANTGVYFSAGTASTTIYVTLTGFKSS